jgi:Trk K+ transport system NAD-binding subunit
MDRFSRILRVLWRDTTALWREFRTPFLIFLIAVFFGGWLYGELLVYAGYPRLPYVNLPYLMLTMMVVETATEVPPEPYLVAFWYIMPAIALYVVGHGAVDFVRLFFNRGKRRRAWEEAVASTYRNHVIVLGVGHVGMRVIRTLAQMGFEVVAINLTLNDETDQELAALDVPCVIGDGRQVAILASAGLQYARALIICTSDDYLNLEVTMRAREFNPNARIVVRMWDSQFASQLHRFMGVEAVLSASELAAPAFAGAAIGVEIAQTLHIHGEEYSLIRVKVGPGSFLAGVTIGDLQERYQMDIVLYEHGGEAEVHPSNSIPVNVGDSLVVFARHSQIVEIVTRTQALRSS